MARLTPSPQLGQQQQSEQHSNPQRNARCSGLTVREKQHVFRVEGSYTANLWAGMPASTSWAIRWMLGIVGRWSIPAGTASSTLSHPTGQCREGSMVHLPTCRSHPGQHRVPWPGDWACASPTVSQQIHLHSSLSTGLPMSHLPCAVAQTLTLPHPCPIPALNHSFTLCIRKETAHCQISYLEGNLATFIEPL